MIIIKKYTYDYIILYIYTYKMNVRVMGFKTNNKLSSG